MKPEHFHPIPAVRRAREKASKELGMGEKPEHSEHGGHNPHHAAVAEHGPIKRTEVEADVNGTHHLKAHHEDGHVSTSKHHNSEQAHAQGAAVMSGEGDSYAQDQHGDQDAVAAQEALGGEHTPEGLEPESEECPHCGGKMEGGKCSQCGYEKGEEAEEQNG